MLRRRSRGAEEKGEEEKRESVLNRADIPRIVLVLSLRLVASTARQHPLFQPRCDISRMSCSCPRSIADKKE